MKQIPGAPDGRNNQRPQVMPLPQRDGVTGLQINTLLSIGGMLTNILLHPLREHDDPKWRDNPALDGGVLAAAETTFINLCSKLDEIISDKTRWSFDAQNTLEAKLEAVYDANLEFTQAQTAAARGLEAPHRKYNPSLMRLRDGNWAAILGSLDKLDEAITGIGATPALALEAFDGIFTGQLPEHLIEWLKKKQEQHEQQQNANMESSGGTQTSPVEIGGKVHPRRNRRKAATKPRVRSDKTPKSRRRSRG